MGIILNEIAERLVRRQHPLGIALQKARLYLLPSLALLLVMLQLLNFPATANSVRIVETVTWVAVIVSTIPLINALFTTGKKPIQWQLRVPNLLFQVIRAVVVLSIGSYVLNGIWNVNLSGVAAALGVGSLVIALALQETLSNLVAGFLLLFAKPFKIGDWIKFNDIESRIIDQNWWSVTLEHLTWDYTISVPNSVLAKATVTNYSRKAVWKEIEISFSYNDPPNRVIPALESIGAGLDALERPLWVGLKSYGESSITYSIWYKALPEKGGLYYALTPRIYYTAKRHGFTIYPHRIEYEYKINADQAIPTKIPIQQDNRTQEQTMFLRSLPYFKNLNEQKIALLASQAHFQSYGAGELITQEGQSEEGFYILFQGHVRTWTVDQQGKLQEVNRLAQGDVFGESAIFPGEVSPITATAVDDVEVVMILKQDMVQLIQNNARFGLEMSQFIEERKRTIRLVKGRDGEEKGSSKRSH